MMASWACPSLINSTLNVSPGTQSNRVPKPLSFACAACAVETCKNRLEALRYLNKENL
jgi:hypothetical protein